MAVFEYTVDLSWNGNGSPGVNVWDIRVGDLVTARDEFILVSSAINEFYDRLALNQIFPADYVARGRNYAVDIDTRQEVAVPTWQSAASTGAGDFAGLLQMVMTIRTESRTRRGRGRKFIGPVAETALSADGTPTSSAVANLQAAADALLEDSTGTNNWAVGVHSSVDGLFRDATDLRARDYFAGLRSRRS